MQTIAIQPSQTAAGPLSSEGSSILKNLQHNGEIDITALRESVSLIRSRFWKAIFDLKALGLVTINVSA